MDKYIIELYWALLKCEDRYKINGLYIDKRSQELYTKTEINLKKQS